MFNIRDTVRIVTDRTNRRGEEHQITVVEIASQGLQYRLANISGRYLPDELELVTESTIKTEFKVGDIVQMTRTTQP